MERSTFSTNFSTNILNNLYEIFSGIVEYNELNKKMRKRNNLSKYIIEIVNKLSEEDIFIDVDKEQLFAFLYSRINLIPYDISKIELTRRLRKIMAVEVMSKILDGVDQEEIEDLVRSFK